MGASAVDGLVLPYLVIVGFTSLLVALGARRRTRLPRSSLRRLNDAQLCRAWRNSTSALRVLTAPAELLVLAARRQEYLDELERRNTDGFHAWIEAGDGADELLEGFFVVARRAEP